MNAHFITYMVLTAFKEKKMSYVLRNDENISNNGINTAIGWCEWLSKRNIVSNKELIDWLYIVFRFVQE